MNSLDNLAAVLEDEHDVSHEIDIDESIRKKALKPIERMPEFSRSQRQSLTSRTIPHDSPDGQALVHTDMCMKG